MNINKLNYLNINFIKMKLKDYSPQTIEYINIVNVVVKKSFYIFSLCLTNKPFLNNYTGQKFLKH